MRQILLKFSLLAIVATPLAAHAASTDLITLTQVNSPTTIYQFTVSATPTISGTFADNANSPFAGSFYLNITPTKSPVADPCSGPTCDPVFFYDSANGGGIEDDGISLILEGNQLFGGTLSNPTFAISSGLLTSPTGAASFNYSITAVTTPGTAPEPSSLVLLGTGAVGLLGAFRRRLLA